MPDKPSYIGLLNAIAVNEARAHQYLSAWIETTDDPEVRAVLCTVCAREGEHGMSFAKRINELGFEVREKEDVHGAEQLALASSQLSDLQKIEKLGLHELDKLLEGFHDVFKDHSIDILTGELLGRYIAEEFDSARLLRSCWEQLACRADAGSQGGSQGAARGGQLAALESKVDMMCDSVEELRRSVEELRQIVCAQSMPAETS